MFSNVSASVHECAIGSGYGYNSKQLTRSAFYTAWSLGRLNSRSTLCKSIGTWIKACRSSSKVPIHAVLWRTRTKKNVELKQEQFPCHGNARGLPQRTASRHHHNYFLCFLVHAVSTSKPTTPTYILHPSHTSNLSNNPPLKALHRCLPRRRRHPHCLVCSHTLVS